MKQVLLICAFSFFSQFAGHAQFFSKTVVKTRLFQDIVALNPTLGLEKALGNKYSAELEFMYRNRNWGSSGSEGDWGGFY
ncbi:MAG: hypothetical protein GXO89_01995, partial [Chlorobi bacterium]|nr:hypothetical protein [Chlorobiota bacterium]